MAGQEKKKRLALDTNILFDLAAGEDFAHDFIGVFIEKGYVFSVPPTVVQELSAFAFKQSDDGKRDLAIAALRDMRGWGPMTLNRWGMELLSNSHSCSF